MFSKVIYCLVVVVDVNLNVVSVTTYVQTLHATRLPSLYIKYFHLRNRRPLVSDWCKTFPLFTFAPCQCAYANYVFLYISMQYEFFTPF